MMRDKKDLASSLPFIEKEGLILASPENFLTLGYSSKLWGDARDKPLYFKNIKETYHQPQAHTSNVVEVSKEVSTDIFDGSLTNNLQVLLKGYFADCLPIYFYTTEGEWVGLVHSGWKGSLEGIAQVMLGILFKKGFSPENIGCVIGPYRSLLSYEVKEDFRDLFLSHYSKSWIKECFWKENHRYFFDNGLFNLFLIRDLGIRDLFFLDLDIGIDERFFSHRRGDFGRNVAFIFKG